MDVLQCVERRLLRPVLPPVALQRDGSRLDVRRVDDVRPKRRHPTSTSAHRRRRRPLPRHRERLRSVRRERSEDAGSTTPGGEGYRSDGDRPSVARGSVLRAD